MQRSQLPFIHEEDIIMIARQGPTFLPIGQAHEHDTAYSAESYVLHVVFKGGKRGLVDVAYQPAMSD
jgi:hypothetical protein